MPENSLSQKNLRQVGRKLSQILAGLGTIGVAEQANALDFYNSPVFTSANTVGWIGGTPQQASFQLNLTGTNQIQFARGVYVNGATSSWKVAFGAVSPVGLRVANYDRPPGGGFASLTGAAKTFAAGQNWGNKVNDGSFANVAFAFKNQFGTMYTWGKVSPAKTDKYLLFKFTDTGNDYYGWVKTDFANFGSTRYVTVKQYAWQMTNPINAGAVAVPVPEPSTLVTTGIAALTGGALALRRWRKERKTTSEAA